MHAFYKEEKKMPHMSDEPGFMKYKYLRLPNKRLVVLLDVGLNHNDVTPQLCRDVIVIHKCHKHS